MDFLVKSKVTSKEYFTNVIIPLSYRGLGSVDSLLNLKKYEIEVLKESVNNEDLDKLYMVLHGIPVKD